MFESDIGLRSRPLEDSHGAHGAMLTVAEVAQMLSVHVNTVRRWSNQGQLKAYRIGSRGDRRFYLDDVRSFISRQEGNGNHSESGPGLA